ncbi:MAG TPA: type IV toxin-antitoxin system AbiEi family antitoxin domain-containing protein [Solirubrobacterales bacterium]|nr:type IV toxin-antitoxin system AbiEi family antitoxin domain-containing protein [Solirubrobacterales bacterium]
MSDLATAQHGVVSARQLREIGYSRDVVADATKAGRLHRLHRGVYAVGHLDLDWHSHCLAAVLACTPAVASHTSAGWLWGLLRYQPGVVDVTAATRRHPKRTIRLHHARLGDEDRDEREGIPITSLARTQLDLAATLAPARLSRVIERAEELGIFDLIAIEELLGRVTHHPGTGKLRLALAIYRPDPAFTRSGLERRFLALVKRSGLPVPAMNYVTEGFELDAYWEEERFVAELDAYETHGSNAAFERDRLRHEDLKLAGIEMVRITGPRLKREPQRVMERLGVLLARRREEIRPRLDAA